MTARSIYFGDNKQGNLNEVEYQNFLNRVNLRFIGNSKGKPLFKVHVDNLWETYLTSFAEGEERQHHNCNTCRSFVHRYGNLVTVNDDGSIWSAVWDPADAYGYSPQYEKALARMKARVESSSINTMFLSSEKWLGQPKTGNWIHLAVQNQNVFSSLVQQAHQVVAERNQQKSSVNRALHDYNKKTVVTALQLLEANALYRAEKVIGPAKWFFALIESLEGKDKQTRENLVWKAVATAPAGFASIRSSMVGTLLDDIAAGMDFNTVSKRFEVKMDPANYQRAMNPPKVGQIRAAELAVEAMGIAPAFNRRFTKDADLQPGIIWYPSEQKYPIKEEVERAPGGIFGHLKPQETLVPDMDIPAKKITWEKFADSVLPGAAKIEYRAPVVGPFAFLTTQRDEGAPQIIQWDNAVSWSFPNPAARSHDWNLKQGELVPVTAIVKSPNLWGTGGEQHGKGVFLLLEGAKDTRDLPGGGLFTEHLKSELKPYRAVIQAHLDKLKVDGIDDCHAFGIGLMHGNEFTEVAAPVVKKQADGNKTPAKAPDNVYATLVIDDSGSMATKLNGAHEAVSNMVNSLRAMPGNVFLTVIVFGTRQTMVYNQTPLAQVTDWTITGHMHGRHGGTALNDTVIQGILNSPRSGPNDTFFLGIITDGEEIDSRARPHQVRDQVLRVQGLGNWTIAYAGAGHGAQRYAASIGIPEGNIMVFANNEYGFREAGAAYRAGTMALSASYASGATSTQSFFAAAAQRAPIGKDHPILVVTTKNGTKVPYELDRWE